MAALKPGQLLEGTSYQVLREIGAGGMGVVYEIEHVRLKKRYVAKVIHEQVAHDASIARRMEREAQVLAAISHPNVVQVHDVGVTFDGISYFVMEKLEGRDLRNVMKRGRVPPHRATAIVSDVLDALEHVHGRGVIHRDIKPENIFLADGPLGPVTKVLDFGIVHVLDKDGHASQARITKTGGFVGTLYYAAPEQMQGKPAGPANDVYAAGLVLFELLAGNGPFDDDPGVGLSRCFKPAPPLTDFVPAAPPELASLIARALEQEPSLRPSAGTVAAELRAISRSLAVAHGPEEDAVRAEVEDLLRHMVPLTDARPLPRVPNGAPAPARANAPPPPKADTPPIVARASTPKAPGFGTPHAEAPRTVASAQDPLAPPTAGPATPVMPGAPRAPSRPSLNEGPTMASAGAVTPAPEPPQAADAHAPPAPHLSTSPGLYATVDGPPIASPPARSRTSWVVASVVATMVLGAGVAGAIAVQRHAGEDAAAATAAKTTAPASASPSGLSAEAPPTPDPPPTPSSDRSATTASAAASAPPAATTPATTTTPATATTPATTTATQTPVAKTAPATKPTARTATPKPAATTTPATPKSAPTVEVDMDGRVIRR